MLPARVYEIFSSHKRQSGRQNKYTVMGLYLGAYRKFPVSFEIHSRLYY
jgi:hypothetical protein